MRHIYQAMHFYLLQGVRATFKNSCQVTVIDRRFLKRKSQSETRVYTSSAPLFIPSFYSVTRYSPESFYWLV